ncbi:hypothetical protein ACFSC6_00040 [Rufibacter sediminis]|uniref:hypothetical protein n=1 Tax=Rufibacter sediminis TaxID=2762756 RepID=UPI00210E1C9D|nr:hypothetical protein [Rufibacter sediminis]
METTATATLEKDYIKLLQCNQVLNERGIEFSLRGISALQAIGKVDTIRDENGTWWIAKHEMLTRIRESGNHKLPPIEEGWISLEGYAYHLSEAGIKVEEGKVCTQIFLTRSIEGKRDDYGRTLIKAEELQKRIQKGVQSFF